MTLGCFLLIGRSNPAAERPKFESLSQSVMAHPSAPPAVNLSCASTLTSSSEVGWFKSCVIVWYCGALQCAPTMMIRVLSAVGLVGLAVRLHWLVGLQQWCVDVCIVCGVRVGSGLWRECGVEC